jgi:hypothetical protein
MRCAVLFVSLVLVLGACKGRENAADGTETIAPAQPQPAHTGTDDALTQTVDIEDSRSEAEGAVLTNTAYSTDTTTTTATTTATGTATPPTTTTR